VSEAFRKLVESESDRGPPLRAMRPRSAAKKPPPAKKRARAAAPRIRITDVPVEKELRASFPCKPTLRATLLRRKKTSAPLRSSRRFSVTSIAACVGRNSARGARHRAGVSVGRSGVPAASLEVGARALSGRRERRDRHRVARRHHVIFPLPYFQRCWPARTVDNTILLLFNMLVAGNVPPAKRASTFHSSNLVSSKRSACR